MDELTFVLWVAIAITSVVIATTLIKLIKKMRQYKYYDSTVPMTKSESKTSKTILPRTQEKKEKESVISIIKTGIKKRKPQPDIQVIFFDTDRTFWRDRFILDRRHNAIELDKERKIKLMDDSNPSMYIDKTNKNFPIASVFASYNSGVPIDILSKIREGTPTTQEIGNTLDLPTLRKLQSLRETKPVAPFLFIFLGFIFGFAGFMIAKMIGFA